MVPSHVGNNCCRIRIVRGEKKLEKLMQLMQWQLILRLSDVIWVEQIRIVYNTHVNM